MTVLVLLIPVLALFLLGLTARRYISMRLLISGDHGDSLPIGELPENQKVVNLCTSILKDYDFSLSRHHVVLDFGCGTGRHTYEFRDQGFTAFGFDKKHYVKLRNKADIQFFISPESTGGSSIPKPDNTFDFIFSTSTLEHTMDYDSAFREMHRVLKPGGVALHVFPSRLRPIEPHMYVPFGGCFQSYPYFLFWAAMGIRSEIQAGKGWKEAASMNWDYARRGIRYLNKRRILFYAGLHFQHVRFVESSFIRHTRHVSNVSRLVHPVTQVLPFLTRMYAGLHTRVLLLEREQ
jgi:SAM-dependent methyltransferase